MVKSLTATIIFILLSSLLLAQEQEQINSRKSDLSKLRKEISSLEKELKLKSSKEKESYKLLENYNRQNFLLNQLVNKLKEEEQLKQNEIDYSQEQLQKTEQEIKTLQQNYAGFVRNLYKHGVPDEFEVVMSSGSLEKAILRQKYFQKFSEKRRSDLTKLKVNKEQIVYLRDKLEIEKGEKIKLKEQKLKEEANLKIKLEERKKLLSVIKNDKVSIRKEIDAKKTAEIKIRSLINKLIETAERYKRDAEKVAKLESEKLRKNEKSFIKNKKKEITTYDNKTDLSTSGLSSFSVLRGKLNWPVSGGRVIKQFGENRNQKLNTVTINYGVDIKANSDLNVKSVAEGIVSAIDWIPGYGSIVIVTHKDDFRTVYSHLSEIFVKEGNKVKAGSVIARVGESLDGNIIHFEIWNSRTNQNPELWLSRK